MTPLNMWPGVFQAATDNGRVIKPARMLRLVLTDSSLIFGKRVFYAIANFGAGAA